MIAFRHQRQDEVAAKAGIVRLSLDQRLLNQTGPMPALLRSFRPPRDQQAIGEIVANEGEARQRACVARVVGTESFHQRRGLLQQLQRRPLVTSPVPAKKLPSSTSS